MIPIKIVVCALTSSDAPRLERLIRSAKANTGHSVEWQGIVVCNTKNEQYPPLAEKVANDHQWHFYCTESNGKPGMGKNSALDIFTRNYQDYDYLILMDGDDFLYPTAFQQIERVICKTGCDVLGLQTNDILDTLVYKDTTGITLMLDQKQVHLYSWFDNQYNIYALPAQYHKVDRKNSKLGKHSTPDRIILFSHEAASRLSCSIELPVYEDYVLSLNAQSEYLKGNLVYFNTSSTCIYIYDKTGETSTCKQYNKDVNGDWGAHDELFKAEVAALEPTLGDFHAAEVPFVFIPANGQDTPQVKAAYISQMYPLK